MIPSNPPSNSSGLKHLASSHKETQTNITAVKDSSTVSDPSKKSDKGSLAILEFNEILQDPQSPSDITIIKDVFAQEIHDHGSDSSGEDNISNRYTYCREVIKPYLKDYPLDCPVSDEQLIRDALLAAQRDYPDYQPCFEIYDGGEDVKNKKGSGSSTDVKKDNIDKKPSTSKSSLSSTGKKTNSSKSCVPKNNKKSPSKTSICVSDLKNSKSNLDKDVKSKPSETSSGKGNKGDKCKNKVSEEKKAGPSKADFRGTNDAYIIKVCKDYNPSKCAVIALSKESLNTIMSDDEECPPKKRDPKCPKETRRPSIEEEVFKLGKRPPAGPPSACKRKPEDTSTCKDTPPAECDDEEEIESSSKKKKKDDDNPCSYKMEKSSSGSLKSLSTLQPKKSVAAAHNETITTIKSAMEDFFGKMYKSTKEAVGLIKSESAKQLCHMACENPEPCERPPREVSDNHDENETGKKFKIYKALEEAELPELCPDEPRHGLSKRAKMIAGKILGKVDSAISVISDNCSLEKVSSVISIKNFNERYLRRDKTVEETAGSTPTSSSPKSSNFGNNMLNTIKTKIMAIFSENEMKKKSFSNASQSRSSDTNSSASSEILPKNDKRDESQKNQSTSDIKIQRIKNP